MSEKSKIAQAVTRRIGKINLCIGCLSLIAGMTIIMATEGAVVAYGAIVVGIAEIYLGWRQLSLGDDGTRYAVNEALFGSQEPDATWACPVCQQTNQNDTYQCMLCGKSLV